MNTVFGINGPVVTVLGNTGLSMMEMVLVGEEKLVGEVIGITAKATTIQVYENTTGLKVGEPVYATGGPLCATLGPGILDNIFDGIERPLKAIEKLSGDFINRGVSVPSIDADKLWEVTVLVKAGDTLHPGDVYATCPETPIITHKCMVPPQLYGTVQGREAQRGLQGERHGGHHHRRGRPGSRSDPLPAVAHPHPPPRWPAGSTPTPL